jgi:hypothetical protein
LDSLFSRAARKYSKWKLDRLGFFVIAACYIVGHSVILFYMVMTLNVSVNSYSNALLTMLLSNQFVEIKGSVFKRFDKENLFQLACAGNG